MIKTLEDESAFDQRPNTPLVQKQTNGFQGLKRSILVLSRKWHMDGTSLNNFKVDFFQKKGPPLVPLPIESGVPEKLSS